jgi:osmotically inducible protein OsmC
MALSFQLNSAGFTAERLETVAKVIMGQTGHDYHFDKIELHLKGKVPGISDSQFKQLAKKAKMGCPISMALSAVPVELYVDLV